MDVPSPGLSLVGYYGPDYLELQGDSPSLRRFGDMLDHLPGTISCTLHIPGDTSSDREEGFLTTIMIDKHAGPVRIVREGTVLCINGSASTLALLAQNIVWLIEHAARAPSGGIQDHLHIEHYPGHFFLAESSMPLIVSIDDTPR